MPFYTDGRSLLHVKTTRQIHHGMIQVVWQEAQSWGEGGERLSETTQYEVRTVLL